MFPKKNRFTRAQFEAFLVRPGVQTVYNKLGTFKYLHEGHQFGVVTTSKHEKRAVFRNKLRRRLYGEFKDIKTQLSGIFYASKASYALENTETKELFNGLITKTKLNK